MKIAIIIILSLTALFIVIWILAACKAAGQADEHAERMRRYYKHWR